MESLKEFISKHNRSAAYHEAGHITAAVVQAMPISPRGMFIDLQGHGVANYFCREPGDLETTATDARERKLTIIALLAAHAAQERYLPGVDQAGWASDRDKIRRLLAEMNLNEIAHDDLQKDLRQRAITLVGKFWPQIEELGETLLLQPCVDMPVEEAKVNWGIGQVRNLTGEQIRQLFAKYGIRANVIERNFRNYDSTKDAIHYNSLA